MESEASAGEALSLSGGWVDLGAQRGAEVAKGSNLSAAVPAGPEVDVQEERDNQGDVHAPLESQGWLSTSLPAGPMPPQPVQETAVPRTRPSAALPLVLLAVVIACMAAAGLKWTKQPPGTGLQLAAPPAPINVTNSSARPQEVANVLAACCCCACPLCPTPLTTLRNEPCCACACPAAPVHKAPQPTSSVHAEDRPHTDRAAARQSKDSEAPQPSPGRRHANPAAVALLPAPSLREAAHGLPQKAQSPTMQQVATSTAVDNGAAECLPADRPPGKNEESMSSVVAQNTVQHPESSKQTRKGAALPSGASQIFQDFFFQRPRVHTFAGYGFSRPRLAAVQSLLQASKHKLATIQLVLHSLPTHDATSQLAAELYPWLLSNWQLYILAIAIPWLPMVMRSVIAMMGRQPAGASRA